MLRNRRLSIMIATFISLLMLTGCIPSGNVVGKADFKEIDSTFANDDWIGHLEINAAAVTTPNGIKYRITKMVLMFPGHDISFKASKQMFVNSYAIPKSEILSSQLKGRNVCGWVEGQLDNGSYFLAGIYGSPNEGAQGLIFANNEFGYWFVGESINGKLQIGGRNLCGGGGG